MKQTGILVLLLLPLYVFTQVLEGVVYGDDEMENTLPGVNIYWKGTNQELPQTRPGGFGLV